LKDRSLSLAYASIAVILVTVFTAWAFALAEVRPFSLVFATTALLIGRQAALRDPSALTWALLAASVPIAVLVLGRSTEWLVAPLAVLLLVAGELNALSWTVRGASDSRDFSRRRLIDIAKLSLAALVASIVITIVPLAPPIGGTATVVAASTLLAALGWVLFGSREPDS
jgi:hypothetical protein